MLELPIEIAPKPPNPLFFPVCFYRNPARRRLAIANYVSTGTPYVLELPIEIAPKPPNPLFFPVCFYRNPARRRLAIANYVSTGTPYVLELPIEIAPKPPWPLLLLSWCTVISVWLIKLHHWFFFVLWIIVNKSLLNIRMCMFNSLQ